MYIFNLQPHNIVLPVSRSQQTLYIFDTYNIKYGSTIPIILSAYLHVRKGAYHDITLTCEHDGICRLPEHHRYAFCLSLHFLKGIKVLCSSPTLPDEKHLTIWDGERVVMLKEPKNYSSHVRRTKDKLTWV